MSVGGQLKKRLAEERQSVLMRPSSGKVALILGGADCVEKDRVAALALFTPDCVVCINESGRDYPEYFDHWVSMHPNKAPTTVGLEGWVKERRKLGRPDAGRLWIPQHRQPPPGLQMMVSRAPSWGGSSGLLACVVVVVALNCRGVLAGCPMQKDRAHYFDKRIWAEADRYRPSWIRYMPQIKGRIKSMSGWTQEMLGAPTAAWLNGESRAA